MEFLTRHLDDVGESYSQHFRHAMSFSLTMLVGALVCFVHALLPFLFERTGSRFIQRLHDRMVVNRQNLSKPAVRSGWTGSEAG